MEEIVSLISSVSLKDVSFTLCDKCSKCASKWCKNHVHPWKVTLFCEECDIEWCICVDCIGRRNTKWLKTKKQQCRHHHMHHEHSSEVDTDDAPVEAVCPFEDSKEEIPSLTERLPFAKRTTRFDFNWRASLECHCHSQKGLGAASLVSNAVFGNQMFSQDID